MTYNGSTESASPASWPERLRPREASAYLEEKGCHAAPNTMAKWRSIGGGPPFYLIGRFPVYDREDLDEWAAARTSSRAFATTAEARQQAA